GWTIDHSRAGLYMWATHPDHDCWSAAELLAAEGILVAPGELYGPSGARHIRVALTATDERTAAAAARIRARPRQPSRPPRLKRVNCAIESGESGQNTRLSGVNCAIDTLGVIESGTRRQYRER